MAREKFQNLTEPMFYTLLCLKEECCGMDIMTKVNALTDTRISVGPGTLYHLLDQFQEAEMICETRVEGRKRYYKLTEGGALALSREYRRLQLLAEDYLKIMR